jgi:hypothetical protein
MNWLGRILVGSPTLTVTSPAAGRCPRCQAIEATRVCSIVGWKMAEGAVVVAESGSRFSCQRCGEIYSVGPAGVFQHHAEALPPSPKWRESLPAPERRVVAPSPRRDDPLIAKERPRA